MRADSVLKGLGCGLLVLGLAACGGATLEAEAKAGSTEGKADDADEKKADDDADEKKAEEKKKDEVPDKTPQDFITEAETFFALSFKDSDFGQKKIEACEKKAKGDPEKRAKCITKARKPYEGEGIRFIKDDDGTWWWLTMGLQGGKIFLKHRIEFEIGEQTDTTITLKLKGRDRGRKPMGAVPSTLTIEVPNDYEIYLDDKRLGKMVYKARVATGSEEEEK